jgi:hypothetical protein
MQPVARVSIKYQNTPVSDKSVDILVTPFKYIFGCKSPEDGHWSGPKHVVYVESAQ